MLYLPRYLDTDLARTILQGFGVDAPDTINVETTTDSQTSKGVGLDTPIVRGDRRRANAAQRKETFQRAVTPSQLLELMLRELRDQGQLVDLVTNPMAAITKRSVIEIDGDITSSAISDVLELMKSFAPLMENGVLDPGDMPPEALDLMIGKSDRAPLILNMKGELQSLLLKGERTNLVGSNEVDDLEDALTVLGYVEKVIEADRKCPLDRFVLPGMNRAMRRTFGRETLLDLIETSTDDERPPELDYTGPGIVVTPIAIYV